MKNHSHPLAILNLMEINFGNSFISLASNYIMKKTIANQEEQNK